jgi:hypothetical protein
VEVVIGGSDGGERRGRTVPVGGENGVGEEKWRKERVFSGNDSGERIWWRENGLRVPVPMDAVRGRTGLEGEWALGGNEIISALFYLWLFLKKKKVKDRRTWHMPCHLCDYYSIMKVVGVSLLQNACQV